MLVRAVLDALVQDGIRFTVLSEIEHTGLFASTDCDIAVHSEDLKRLPRVLLERLPDETVLINALRYQARSLLLVIVSREIDTHLFLDVSADFRWHGLILLDKNRMCVPMPSEHDYPRPSPAVEYEYRLIKRLLKRDWSESSLRSLYAACILAGDAARVVTDSLLGIPLSRQLTQQLRAGEVSVEVLRAARLRLLQRRYASPLTCLRFFIEEALRLATRVLYPSGLVIAVVGPDGAGKTHVVERMQTWFSPWFRASVRAHLRPSHLRRARQGEGLPVANPQSMAPRGRFLSVAKALVFWADYTLGYALWAAPKSWRTTLVIFDRYSSDLLVDPLRFRYSGPKWLAWIVTACSPQPAMTLALNAPISVVSERKQELSRDEIDRQTGLLVDLSRRRGGWVLINTDCTDPELHSSIQAACVSFLSQRLARRVGGRGRSSVV